ncbi:MAG: calcium/sodium antiporter [Candidatus Omnitrophota bacterium]
MLPYILLIMGFVFLIKGAGDFVDGASSLARKLSVSDLTVGLTVVAFGTSLPELFVNIFASFQCNTDIAIGNVLGSNISNILLILGIAAVVYPMAVTKGTVWKEIPLSLLAAVLVGVLANDAFFDGVGFSTLTRIDGIIFIAFFIIFLYYTASIARDITGINKYVNKTEYRLRKVLFKIILGLGGLFLGANLVVDRAVYLAQKLGVSQSLVGLTIVAAGTSLPELATSAVAAYKKNAEIAIGNIVGSNIFNIFFILGISAIIKPLPFRKELNIDAGMAILASMLLFLCMFTGKKHKLDRWEGIIFIVLYIGYISFLIMRG